MRDTYFAKKLLTILFLALLAYVWVNNASYTTIGNLYDYLVQDTFLNKETDVEENDEESDENDAAEERLLVSDICSAYTENFNKKNELVNLNGAIAKLFNIRGLYRDIGMYVYDEGYIVSAAKETSTDYEYEQMVDLKKFLDERGINLLYVNQPTKYVDDAIFKEEFGVESYCNRNADKFLERISAAGINIIDLRDEMLEDEMNVYNMFYRTDHHWTTESGLWAAEKIAEGLNEYCGYDIDLSIYNHSNYSFEEVQDCWIGEQGRKVGLSYVGLDDFTIIRPNFETNYTYIYVTKPETYDGTFDEFINDEVYSSERANGSYYGRNWYYSYSGKSVINHNVETGKILLLSDSYAQVMEPFLSLGVGEIKKVLLRDFKGNIREVIENAGCDTVVIAYAEFMIGAHDNPESSNYKMFAFD